jgi:hypothetical protein
VGPQVAALNKKIRNLRVRKINIAKWKSPAAKRYGLNSIPALWLYNGNKLVTKSNALTVLAAAAKKGRL